MYNLKNIKPLEEFLLESSGDSSTGGWYPGKFIVGLTNKMAAKFIKIGLGDTIERAEQFNKEIKEKFDALKEEVDSLQKENSSELNTKAVQKYREMLDTISKFNTDLLKIDTSLAQTFGSFIAAVGKSMSINIGSFFTPFRTLQIIGIGYQLYLSLIKKAIIKNIILVELAVDQFLTKILHFDKEADLESAIQENTQEILSRMFYGMGQKAKGKNVQLATGDVMSKKDFEKMQKVLQRLQDQQRKDLNSRNPLASLNNTFDSLFDMLGRDIKSQEESNLDQEAEQYRNLLQSLPRKSEALASFANILQAHAIAAANRSINVILNNYFELIKVFKTSSLTDIQNAIVAEAGSNNYEKASKSLEDPNVFGAEDNEKQLDDDLKKQEETGKKLVDKGLTKEKFDKLSPEEQEAVVSYLRKKVKENDGEWKECPEELKYLAHNNLLEDDKLIKTLTIPEFIKFLNLNKDEIEDILDEIDDVDSESENLKDSIDDNKSIQEIQDKTGLSNKEIIALLYKLEILDKKKKDEEEEEKTDESFSVMSLSDFSLFSESKSEIQDEDQDSIFNLSDKELSNCLFALHYNIMQLKGTKGVDDKYLEWDYKKVTDNIVWLRSHKSNIADYYTKAKDVLNWICDLGIVISSI